jgi:hypothetical protein
MRNFTKLLNLNLYHLLHLPLPVKNIIAMITPIPPLRGFISCIGKHVPTVTKFHILKAIREHVPLKIELRMVRANNFPGKQNSTVHILKRIPSDEYELLASLGALKCRTRRAMTASLKKPRAPQERAVLADRPCSVISHRNLIGEYI